MGRDKALLSFQGVPLVARVAEVVARAAGSAVVIGDPGKYSGLGYAVVPDRRQGLGPLAGIEAALDFSTADWNLVLACDMPDVSAAFLRALLETAAASDTDVLLPAGPSGQPEPLSAVYHRRCLPAIVAALDAGTRKITDALASLRVAQLPVIDDSHFQNLNTPEEWACRNATH